MNYKYPVKWNISVTGGKETNKYFVSTGEGKWKKKNIYSLGYKYKFIS